MGVSRVNKIILWLSLIALLIAGGIIFALERIKPHIESLDFNDESVQEPEETPPNRAQQVINALAASYPVIEKAEFRNGDWALLLRDTWFYYAEGRLLPEELLDKVSEYSSSLSMYNYQSELPPWTEPSPEQAARYSLGRNNNNANTNTQRPQITRSMFFQEALWQASSHAEASRRVKSVSLFGKSVTVHSDIAEIVSRVEERVREIAKTDAQVQTWITDIGEIHGWNWRNVAGSAARSNHSYGIAIDILPKSLGGKATYWQWTENWWNVPYERRYHPPDAVVKAFESYGFIWGGKWTYYDTMHFEYRPDVFILNSL